MSLLWYTFFLLVLIALLAFQFFLVDLETIGDSSVAVGVLIITLMIVATSIGFLYQMGNIIL